MTPISGVTGFDGILRGIGKHVQDSVGLVKKRKNYKCKRRQVRFKLRSCRIGIGVIASKEFTCDFLLV